MLVACLWKSLDDELLIARDVHRHAAVPAHATRLDPTGVGLFECALPAGVARPQPYSIDPILGALIVTLPLPLLLGEAPRTTAARWPIFGSDAAVIQSEGAASGRRFRSTARLLAQGDVFATRPQEHVSVHVGLLACLRARLWRMANRARRDFDAKPGRKWARNRVDDRLGSMPTIARRRCPSQRAGRNDTARPAAVPDGRSMVRAKPVSMTRAQSQIPRCSE